VKQQKKSLGTIGGGIQIGRDENSTCCRRLLGDLDVLIG